MLLEEILSKTNMEQAYKRVTGNKGAAGVDGITVTDFAGQLKAEWEAVKSKLESGASGKARDNSQTRWWRGAEARHTHVYGQADSAGHIPGTDKNV